jgi:hypothetical protein
MAQKGDILSLCSKFSIATTFLLQQKRCHHTASILRMSELFFLAAVLIDRRARKFFQRICNTVLGGALECGVQQPGCGAQTY